MPNSIPILILSTLMLTASGYLYYESGKSHAKLAYSESKDPLCFAIYKKIFGLVHSGSILNCTEHADCKFFHSRVVDRRSCNTFLVGQDSQNLINLERVHKAYCPMREVKTDCDADQPTLPRDTIQTIEAQCIHNRCVEQVVDERVWHGSD